MKLDRFWRLTRYSWKCPKCMIILYEDTNENKEATHYCANCNQGFTIIYSEIRNKLDGKGMEV